MELSIIFSHPYLLQLMLSILPQTPCVNSHHQQPPLSSSTIITEHCHCSTITIATNYCLHAPKNHHLHSAQTEDPFNSKISKTLSIVWIYGDVTGKEGKVIVEGKMKMTQSSSLQELNYIAHLCYIELKKKILNFLLLLFGSFRKERMGDQARYFLQPIKTFHMIREEIC